MTQIPADEELCGNAAVYTNTIKLLSLLNLLLLLFFFS